MFHTYYLGKAYQEQLLREAEQARLARVVREFRQTRTVLVASALALAGVCIAALIAAGA
jgi:hypothetical protein